MKKGVASLLVCLMSVQLCSAEERGWLHLEGVLPIKEEFYAKGPDQSDEVNRWLRPQKIPYPEDNALTSQRSALGKLLFFDVRLSKSDDIACATCHDPYLGWSDGKAKAIGHKNQKGRRNSPTILNSAYQTSFFWDGRASSLEEQALMPIASEVEMGMEVDELVDKLNTVEGYKKLFEAAYGERLISKENIAKALASFQRTVVSGEAPFDRWIKGDKTAMSPDAVEGFEHFRETGKCVKCHKGFNFTDQSFANIALGDPDLGVYELRKNLIWYSAFKTPTLRNVAKTAPYFHDGSVHTLEEAVHICGNGGRYKDIRRSPFFRDRGLTVAQTRKIVAFLEMLSSDDDEVSPPLEFPR